ncbi:MAG: cytidylate kinase-like family protein [Desulfobacterales bacterium]|jgi:cytidylate kinase
MKTKSRSIEQIIEEQMQRWQLMKSRKVKEKQGVSTITISREPGSGGSVVAKKLAAKLDFKVFHQEVLIAIAKRADVSDKLLATLDEKGLNVLEDCITALVYDRHLWPDEYLKHLMKVIGAIGKHGSAIIVGRGANFVVPPQNRLRLRIVAPQNVRIANVARAFDVKTEDARRHIIRTESDRRAFIRKYFNADITDPNNYDIVINTGALEIDKAVEAVIAALG